MDPDRIDLSSLDPSRDARRWEEVVRQVAARGATARRPRPTVPAQLAGWWRPALALVAAAAAAAWLPVLLSSPSPAPGAEEVVAVSDPVLSTAAWTVADQSPGAARIIASLGATNADR
jgi:hypothetical protein